ncbi:molybdopterin synthase catalytic subunit MoaE [Parashewanella tropica]|uniref:molybdopterin synthase catalytic subunit MoaE n=1 Tax=Parashewanella tropica TaxID=2547970 RepID=UPI00105A30B2|nr:molybdopterin synthase catalytic subunit MoaE [Parashewanella tropica]
MENTHILVQQADFNVADEYTQLSQDDSDGAIVTFVGKVRNRNEGNDVSQLTLEHYPGMTEKVLQELALEARERWSLNHIRIIHRVGTMELGEQIVFIGVTSQHRQAAFDGCEFLIDFLKTKAPFWKLEATDKGDKWVDARETDQHATSLWQ